MTELQQKQLALLEDTAKFFNRKNRAYYKGEGCMYHTPDGRGCAIGRLIPDKQLCRKMDKGIGGFGGINNNEMFYILPEELKMYTKDFLSDLQGLHDNSYNWEDSGISLFGKGNVEEMKIKYKLN